jgi:hypothetical protein
MLYQLLAGGLVSLINFSIHVVMTGVIVVVTRHVAGQTDDLHIFLRVTALQMITICVLTLAHVLEISVWAGFLHLMGIAVPNVPNFVFAFENYTALGYGDVVAGSGWRLIGPIMALNGLLLIGISVAIVFEVMKLANVEIGRRHGRSR